MGFVVGRRTPVRGSIGRHAGAKAKWVGGNLARAHDQWSGVSFASRIWGGGLYNGTSVWQPHVGPRQIRPYIGMAEYDLDISGDMAPVALPGDIKGGPGVGGAGFYTSFIKDETYAPSDTRLPALPGDFWGKPDTDFNLAVLFYTGLNTAPSTDGWGEIAGVRGNGSGP